MKTNQLTLLRDIKTVDQLIIKLNELGYTRGDDFEDEEKDWGMINKYLVSEMDEYTRPGDFESIITINPKSWLNNEDEKMKDPFVDFSTSVAVEPGGELSHWSVCYVEYGESWATDPNSVYIEKLDDNLIEFIKVADEKLDQRQKQQLEEMQKKYLRRRLKKGWGFIDER
jgi:hypothetical protein